MDDYNDIRNMPHHISESHPQMPVAKRAAQFMPFAALSGHAEAAKERERITEPWVELDEYEKEKIDRTLRRVNLVIASEPEVEVTYFIPDERKSGGKYVTEKRRVKRIDVQKKRLVMTDGSYVDINYLHDISDGMEFYSAE